ncbi:hypothetical protein FKG94_12530 [Exilibacterium tricleocarpae]|uniref:Fibronectin type-III domain-containing protein n=1 Tax=Exilibacterium tricleocarpae TaxID=2591008 RepID=A0A545TNN7_9GAMM|nr:RHS repeat-associated core domain-containing protein [Exilibacterium tricleocarpae]TQV78840.1 hypothetical protein FKG94_12530 [Exilibacterium tricleocarpae]
MLGKVCVYIILVIAGLFQSTAFAYLTSPASRVDDDGSYIIGWERPDRRFSWFVSEYKDGVYAGFVAKKSWGGLWVELEGRTEGVYRYDMRYSYRGEVVRVNSVTVTVEQRPGCTGSIVYTGVSNGTTDNDGGFSISWGAAATGRVTHYLLEQRKDSGNWTPIHQSTALSANVGGLSDGTYTYRVSACNTIADLTLCSSARSAPNAVTVLKKPGVPGAITGPDADTDGSFALSWGAATGTVGSYRLEQKIGSGAWSQIHNSSARSKNISVAGSGTYYYRLRACNGAGCSSYGATKQVNVAIPLPAPAVPGYTGFPAQADTGDYDIRWSAPAGTVAYYQLQEKRNTGNWTAIAASGLRYQARGKPQGQYRYRLRACNSDACSNWNTSALINVHNLDQITPVVTIAPTDEAGSLAYQAAVTGSGDAIVNIPIHTAPGVNGVEPGLSLAYNSGRARQQVTESLPEDVLGYGWRLSGFSQIRRCVIHRSDADIVQLTDDDAICLDGEPLVLVGGSHWQPGALYRTLRDRFIRIELKGTAAAPWFEVTNTSGAVSQYGATANARINVVDSRGESAYFSWQRNRVTDVFGNRITYRYHTDRLTGIAYPLDITYGHNNDAQVTFEYATRNDAQPMPLGPDGIGQGQLVLLHHINVTLDGRLVREYRLVSETAAQGWKRLDQVQVCGFDSSGTNASCLPPLNFDWVVPTGSNALDFKTAINRVTDGHGNITEFDHTMMTQGGSEAQFFERPFGNAIAPADTAPMPADNGWLRCVVTEMRRSNGLGGFHRQTYAYHGKGLINTRNWGFIGYYAQRIRDEQSGITTYRQQRLDFPHFGRVAQVHQYDNLFGGHTETLSKTYTYLANQSLTIGSGTTLVPTMPRRISMVFENDVNLGAQVADTAYQFSGGLLSNTVATQRVVESVSFSGTPVAWGQLPPATLGTVTRSSDSRTTYSNRTAGGAWLIGFAAGQETRWFDGDVSTSPIRTQTVAATPHGNTNAVSTATQYPGDTQYELTTRFDYNTDGYQTGETVSGAGIQPRSINVSSFIDRRYPQTLTNALNQSITSQTDPRFGTPTRITDANNRTTVIDYDNLGRETARTNADGVVFSTVYDACSVIICDSVNGVVPSYRVRTHSSITPTRDTFFDSLGRVMRTAVEAFTGSTWIYQDTYYDNQGRIDRRTQPYYTGESIDFFYYHYDNRDRVVRTVRPDGSEVRMRVQADGAQHQVRITTEHDVLSAGGTPEETQVQHSLYDLTGDLVRTVDAAGTVDEISTVFTYDGSGLILSAQVDASPQNTTTFTYDRAGVQTHIAGPNIGTVRTVRNALGELISHTDNQGNTLSFTYDLLGRLTRQVDAEGTAAWTYDPHNAVGALASRTYKDFSETYRYTTEARLDSITTVITANGFNNTYTHSYGYDTQGRVSAMTYPSGIMVGYDYNARGYLSVLSDKTTASPLKTYQHTDAFGQVTGELYGNGIATTRTFNAKTGALESISSLDAGTIQDNEYRWKSNSVLESRLQRDGATVKKESFIYDGLNRLTRAATLIDGSQTRTLQTHYDRLGNLLGKTSSHTGDITVSGYQYGGTANAGPHAVSAATIDGRTYALHYDANGAIIHYDAPGGDDKWITWNARQLPVDIVVGDSRTDSTPTARDRFWYGPDGQRFYKETRWLDATQTLRTEHTFYIGAYEDLRPANDPDYQRIEKVQLDTHVMQATLTDHLNQVKAQTEYLHRDHLGSVEKVTDEAGNILLDTAFDPFGNRKKEDWRRNLNEQERQRLLEAVNLTTKRGFTNHEHLDRTGIIHMNGRIYDPTLGRFLSPDPYVQFPTFSQSWNRYSYVLNNPLNATDPSGYNSVATDLDLGPCFPFICKPDIDWDPSGLNPLALGWLNNQSNYAFGRQFGGGVLYFTYLAQFDEPIVMGYAPYPVSRERAFAEHALEVANGGSVTEYNNGDVGDLTLGVIQGAIASSVNDTIELLCGLPCLVAPPGANNTDLVVFDPADTNIGQLGQDLGPLVPLGGLAGATRVFLKGATKGIPFGFKNAGDFAQFGKALNSGLAEAGFGGTKALLQGSAVTGKSFRTGKAFDAGRISDFDIALAGPQILARAKQLGIGLRSGGTRTGPLTAAQVQRLGLGGMQSTLSKQAGRPVNFMIYGDAGAAASRAPSIGF